MRSRLSLAALVAFFASFRRSAAVSESLHSKEHLAASAKVAGPVDSRFSITEAGIATPIEVRSPRTTSDDEGSAGHTRATPKRGASEWTLDPHGRGQFSGSSGSRGMAEVVPVAATQRLMRSQDAELERRPRSSLVQVNDPAAAFAGFRLVCASGTSKTKGLSAPTVNKQTDLCSLACPSCGSWKLGRFFAYEDKDCTKLINVSASQARSSGASEKSSAGNVFKRFDPNFGTYFSSADDVIETPDVAWVGAYLGVKPEIGCIRVYQRNFNDCGACSALRLEVSSGQSWGTLGAWTGVAGGAAYVPGEGERRCAGFDCEVSDSLAYPGFRLVCASGTSRTKAAGTSESEASGSCTAKGSLAGGSWRVARLHAFSDKECQKQINISYGWAQSSGKLNHTYNATNTFAQFDQDLKTYFLSKDDVTEKPGAAWIGASFADLPVGERPVVRCLRLYQGASYHCGSCSALRLETSANGEAWENAGEWIAKPGGAAYIIGESKPACEGFNCAKGTAYYTTAQLVRASVQCLSGDTDLFKNATVAHNGTEEAPASGANASASNASTAREKVVTLKECLDAVHKAGGTYFILGKGKKAGKCYMESTTSRECSEGWEDDDFDFFQVIQMPKPEGPDNNTRLDGNLEDMEMGGEGVVEVRADKMFPIFFDCLILISCCCGAGAALAMYPKKPGSADPGASPANAPPAPAGDVGS